MTLQEYILKYDSIDVTHPAPEGASFREANKHYRAILEEWKKELSDDDRKKVESQENHNRKKMAS